MSSKEPRSLRPRRPAKGKYREMLGIQEHTEDAEPDASSTRTVVSDESVSKNGVEIPDNNKKVFFLPVGVMLGEANEIEIEITEEPAPQTSSEKISAVLGDPLQHIDQILAKNDRLMESMPEGPSFKKRRKAAKEEENDENAAMQDNSVHPRRVARSRGSSAKQVENENKIVHFNLDAVTRMMHRPLTKDEEFKVEGYLKEGKPENVLTLLLSNNADNRVWKCVECQELVIGSDEMYVAHYTQIHPHLDEPAFACELCAHITSSSADYQVHLHSHISGGLNASVPVSDSNDEDGMATSMPANGPYVCDICGKTLKHQKSLYSHRRTHTDAKAVCHICGATLKSSRYLHHHLLLHKNVDKPHKCDKCDKAFLSSSALKVHHYYNHEEHPGRFQCSICGKNFKAKQGLQFHMDSHSSELRYECSFCQKRFRGFKTCRVHEMRHKEANEPNKFCCNVCGKLFKTRQTLKNHEDVHASFNRYQCSLCEKRFKLRKSCLAHIRVHHSENERAGGGTGETTHQGQDQQQQLHTGTDEEGEMAVETLLAEAASAAASAEDDEDEEDEEGRQYVVTLAEDHDDAIDDQGIQLIQPGRIVAILPAGAEVECDETVETIVVEC